MRSTGRWRIVCGLVLWSICVVKGQVPFDRGVNLTGWFQVSSPTQIHFTRYTRDDFEKIKSLGCDVVRLPINLHAMTSGEPDYIPDPLFLSFLDQVVTWCEELEIHLVLDNHTFDVNANTDPAIGPVLEKVWANMAAHYKDRSMFLYYEVLNEPHGISDALWGAIQGDVIDAIRAVDPEHYIVVGPANWNSYHNLEFVPHYTDDRLIYTFHFYDPFIFTHQGASWTNPSMVPLADVPFPWSAAAMPSVPGALAGTWIAGAMNNYSAEGNEHHVRSLIDIADDFREERGVPIFCGEFGVHIPTSPTDDRTYWYRVVREYLEQQGISWTIWDYHGGFGLFEEGSNGLFNYDLNVPLLEALAMNVPPQQVYVKRPATSGFVIYDDYIGAGIRGASNPGAGTLDYYQTVDAKEGIYSIYWTEVGQYAPIAFDFQPDLDMSLMPAHDYVLSFWVKGDSPSARFDIRFMDTKAGPSDRPWRMGKTIDQDVVPFDGEWHFVSLPLSELEEKGSFDGAWFPPEGKFDWRNIDRLEIIPEHQDLNGITFWFDQIEVTGEEIPEEEIVTSIGENKARLSTPIIYPNPAHQDVAIEFSTSTSGYVEVSVISLTGQEVSSLCNEFFPAGNHRRFFALSREGKLFAPGMYLVKVAGAGEASFRKLMILR